MRKIIVFDLETQKLADEVGGWGNIKDMLLSVGVTQDLSTREFSVYYEKDAKSLIQELYDADLVIGFNQIRFDYTVLKHYGLHSPAKIKSLDMLAEIERALGHRLSLDAVCSVTLKTGKSADGIDAVRWFKKGKFDQVTEYCKKDVEITRGLYLFGKENGYLKYKKRNGKITRIPVDW